ncbi:hypothetical protein EXIGLDRAFT_836743 [Exidia glandulosa HHB12029]|uniref:DUF6532 domain-containing protein n=1 Tax=Exidia glandulosa HHB12029 TaxID=1314781 RepID=A0A165HHL8_EXIGL|nr:hypothetical protein EXIGLDRAFT_836743 [Exidia glandulosa HHB12029]
MRHIAFEDRARQQQESVVKQFPDKFVDGLPFELYAYACTMVEFALHCIKSGDESLQGSRWMPVYRKWALKVPEFFNDSKQWSKMQELREEHWDRIRNEFPVGGGGDVRMDSLDTDDEA